MNANSNWAKEPVGTRERTLGLLKAGQLALCVVGNLTKLELFEPDDVAAELVLEDGSETAPGEPRLVGVLAIVGGVPQASMLEPVEQRDIDRLSAMFIRYVAFVVGQRIATMPNANDIVH